MSPEVPEGAVDGSMILAASLDGLARVYQAQGRLSEAEPLWREALECRERTLGVEHPLYAESLRCLSSLYQLQGNFAEAQKLQEQARASSAVAWANGTPSTCRRSTAWPSCSGKRAT